jgi:hypothetical protein
VVVLVYEDVDAREAQRVHVTAKQAQGALAVSAATMLAHAPVANVRGGFGQLDANRSALSPNPACLRPVKPHSMGLRAVDNNLVVGLGVLL